MWASALQYNILTGISQMVSSPQPAWASFVILYLIHRFASTSSCPFRFFSGTGLVPYPFMIADGQPVILEIIVTENH
jgi:hypothetical protein